MTCARPDCTRPPHNRGLCRPHYQAAWKAGEFVGVPAPRRGAQHECPPDHKHAATTTCYSSHNCRCSDCRTMRSNLDRARAKAHAYGRWLPPLVDADPARQHVAYLRLNGMGKRRFAEVAQVGHSVIDNLVGTRRGTERRGRATYRIHRTTEARILAIHPDFDALAAGALVDARGTRRRLQALIAIGWSQAKLATLLGGTQQNLNGLLTRTQVTKRKHLDVAALFDQLWDQTPAHTEWRDQIAFNRARNLARRRRWLPPLAWDDIDNDVEPPVTEDPAGIDEMAIALAVMGEPVRLSILERREAVRQLTDRKLNDHIIAARIRVTVRTVERIRDELDIPASVGADKQVIVA